MSGASGPAAKTMLSVPPRTTTDFSRAVQDAGPGQRQALITAIGCLHQRMHKDRVAPMFKAAKPETCAGMERPGRASAETLVVCATQFCQQGECKVQGQGSPKF